MISKPKLAEVDDLFDLADAVREPKTPARPSRGGVAAVVPMSAQDGPVSSRHGGREEPVVAADSEGRAGTDTPGAVPFTLPLKPSVPSFDDGTRYLDSRGRRWAR